MTLISLMNIVIIILVVPTLSAFICYFIFFIYFWISKKCLLFPLLDTYMYHDPAECLFETEDRSLSKANVKRLCWSLFFDEQLTELMLRIRRLFHACFCFKLCLIIIINNFHFDLHMKAHCYRNILLQN